MKFTLTFVAAVSALLSTASAAGTHWTYGQDNAGPQHWGTLDPLYGTCGTGKRQSPIDIALGAPYVTLQKKKMAIEYKPLHDVLCGYDGHTVKCEWESGPDHYNTNSITVKGKKYNLVNFHFHSPSEHRIDNHFADAELHLVHQAADGALAVVGFLLEIQAQANPFFNFVTALDKKVDKAAKGHGFLVKHPETGAQEAGKEQIKYKVAKVDFSSLIKATGTFAPRWEYDGSLTTPPCTEGVSWNVVKTTIPLGLEQYDALVDLEEYNSRFIQDRPHA
ncbi:hypothetical protein BG003_010181 [Podila horticola]|nr:hypothetical protein BG003_010181 [Podila horticola]